MKISKILIVASVFLSVASYAQSPKLYFFDGAEEEMLPTETPISASDLNRVSPEKHTCYDDHDGGIICISGKKSQITSVFDEKTQILTLTTRERFYHRTTTLSFRGVPTYSDKIWGPLKTYKKSVKLTLYVPIPSVKRKLVCEGTTYIHGIFNCTFEPGDGLIATMGERKRVVNFSQIVTLTDAKFLNQKKLDFSMNVGPTPEMVDSLYKEVRAKFSKECKISVSDSNYSVSLTYDTVKKEHTLYVVDHVRKVRPEESVDAINADVLCHFENVKGSN